MYAPPKPDIPVATAATLEHYDAFIFGIRIRTRFGNFPAQWKAFWTVPANNGNPALIGEKFAGIFVSTGSQGGGQEGTALAAMSTLAQHGIVYAPLGFTPAFAELGNLNEVHGGSAWGAGKFAGLDGSRQPTELEIGVATTQGESFGKTVSKTHLE